MQETSLCYDDVGEGPPIVLIHGHPFDRRMWAPQLRTLRDDHRVLAPDLPGYGASPGRGSVMSMESFAQSVLAFVDERELPSAIVVGLSMGGLVAMEIALRAPERVDGVVLAATTAAPVTLGEAAHRRATADAIEHNGMLGATLEMAGRLFGPAAQQDADLVASVLDMMLHAPPAGAAAALRGRAERPDYSVLLRGLRVPSAVIAGDHDGFAGEDVVVQLVDALPDPRVTRLAGTGHLPNLEDPAGFDAAVRRFAAELARVKA